MTSLAAKYSQAVMDINVRPIRHILRTFEEKYGKDELIAFIKDSGLPLEYFDDENNWISYSYLCNLLKSLVEYTGDANAPFAYGLNSAKYVETWGLIKTLCTTLASPSYAIKTVLSNSPRWTKAATVHIHELKRNKAVIEFTMRPDLRQDRNNCLNIQGQLASIPTLWSLPPARVTEKQCAAHGSESCIYELNWINYPYKALRFAALGFGVILAYLLHFMTHRGMLQPSVVSHIAVVAIPALSFFWGRVMDYKRTLRDNIKMMDEQNNALVTSLKQIEDLNKELQNKVQERTKELSDANSELKQAMADLKTSQEKLLDAEKHSAIGILAAGMAHEVNNPLAALKMSLDSLSRRLPGNSEELVRIQRAVASANRCQRIVNEMLAFSREPWIDRNLDVMAVVTQTVNIFAKEHPGGTAVSMDFVEPLPPVMLDQLQIQQALMNILVNASEAMHGGGAVRVATKREGDQVLLSISDNGPGMSKEFLARIFEPFHTSKSHGRGHGLGLSITVQLVRRNGGQIAVESEVGKGTTFIIRFPANVQPHADRREVHHG